MSSATDSESEAELIAPQINEVASVDQVIKVVSETKPAVLQLEEVKAEEKPERKAVCEVQSISMESVQISKSSEEPVKTEESVQEPPRPIQKKETRGIQKWIIRQMMTKPDKFID